MTETLTQKPDFIALTETWIAEYEDAEEYNIEDYQTIISNPRKNVKRRSGGVAFYKRNGLVVKIRALETQIECCLIKVTFTSSVSKLFCVKYRPEKFQLTSFLPEFEKLLLTIKTFHVETIIFGDFNISSVNVNQRTMKYKNLLNAYNFDICNNEPTWVTTKTGSCLDHLIPEKCIYTESVPTTISDHYTIIARIPAESQNQIKKQEIMKVRDLKNLKRKESHLLFFSRLEAETNTAKYNC